MFYITCVSVFDGSVKVVFRSTNEGKLRAKFNEMIARRPDCGLSFTTVKPAPVKQALNVSVLSYE